MGMDLPVFFGVSSLLERLMEHGEGAFPVPQEYDSRHFPPLQVFEGETAVYVRACIPGVSLDAIALTFTGNALRVEGAIPLPEGRCIRHERKCGRFRREIKMPCPVDGEAVEAVMRDGLLTVTLPKASQSAGKRAIPVKTAEGGGA